MLDFKLIRKDGDIWYYEVYPEGKVEHASIVSFNIKTGEKNIVDLGTFDCAPRKYACKVLNNLEDYRQSGEEYPENGMIAWG